MDKVIKMFVKQLAEKGMTEDEISICISSLWSIITDPNVKSYQDLNLEMRAAGWQDFEIDEKAFKMASSAFTS